MPEEMTPRDQCVLRVTDTCALYDLHDSQDLSAATSRGFELAGDHEHSEFEVTSTITEIMGLYYFTMSLRGTR